MKKSSIDKEILKDTMYGCLKELGENDRFFYQSGFGREFCKVNENSEKAALEILTDFICKIKEVEAAEYEKRKKQDTFDALKGELK